MLDCVIVGAGLSGLSAACQLQADGIQNFLVLEARDRVGGRTWTTRVGDAVVDIGGQWIGPGQNRMLALAKKFGVALHEQYSKGRKIVDYGGAISTYNSDIPSLSIPNLVDVQLLIWKVEGLVQSVVVDNPMATPNAKELDSMTVQSFMDRHAWTEGAKKLTTTAIQAVFGVEPCDLSALFFLWYAKQSGSFENLIKIEKGNQQWTFVGGAQQISENLARAIGDKLKFEQPVQQISRGGNGSLLVRTKTGVYEARKVIVAIPPVISSYILYDEGLLTPKRTQLQQRNFMGSIIKAIVLYSTPFWREAGFSGEVIGDCDAKSGPVFNVFDDTLPSPIPGASPNPGLVCFINAQAARDATLLTEPALRAAIVKQLVRWFGQQAANPVSVVICDWVRDPYARGCPIGVFAPGALTAAATELRVPCNNLHWASTETAREFQGFMEGAVEAGERAGREVSSDLQRIAKL